LKVVQGGWRHCRSATRHASLRSPGRPERVRRMRCRVLERKGRAPARPRVRPKAYCRRIVAPLNCRAWWCAATIAGEPTSNRRCTRRRRSLPRRSDVHLATPSSSTRAWPALTQSAILFDLRSPRETPSSSIALSPKTGPTPPGCSPLGRQTHVAGPQFRHHLLRRREGCAIIWRRGCPRPRPSRPKTRRNGYFGVTFMTEPLPVAMVQ
jgi:hypothetical protein